MDYHRLCELLKTELPLNRKERFYTATVLPALLFHDGLRNFYTFLKMIKNFPETINEHASGTDFLFFTEYNLKEASGERNIGRKISTPTNETPDIVIEVLKPTKVFVIIEAKMFAAAKQTDLVEQVIRQKLAIVEPLKQSFKLEQATFYHVAIVPRALKISETEHFQVLNWEGFIEDKRFTFQDCIFYNYLRCALENYDKLVQEEMWTYPSHVTFYLTGEEVYLNGKGDKTVWVGRKQGRQTFIKDVVNNSWRKRKYCACSFKPEKGIPGQWINSEEFTSIVDKNNVTSELLT